MSEGRNSRLRRAQNCKAWNRRIPPWLRSATTDVTTVEARQVAGFIAAVCSRNYGSVQIDVLREQAAGWGLSHRLVDGVTDLIKGGYIAQYGDELALRTRVERWDLSRGNSDRSS